MVGREDAMPNTDTPVCTGTGNYMGNCPPTTNGDTTAPVIPEAYVVENPTSIDASTPVVPAAFMVENPTSIEVSAPVVPAAFMVEECRENEVAIAEVVRPVHPDWWKHKRFYVYMVILVMFFTVIGPVVEYVACYSNLRPVPAPSVSPALPLFQSQSSSLSTEPKCYMVRISAQHYHDNVPAWTIEQVDETDIQELSSSLPTLRPLVCLHECRSLNITEFREDVQCLKKGTYEVTIYNNPLYYDLYTNGKRIEFGYQPGYKKSTTFRVPFVSPTHHDDEVLQYIMHRLMPTLFIFTICVIYTRWYQYIGIHS